MSEKHLVKVEDNRVNEFHLVATQPDSELFNQWQFWGTAQENLYFKKRGIKNTCSNFNQKSKARGAGYILKTKLEIIYDDFLAYLKSCFYFVARTSGFSYSYSNSNSNCRAACKPYPIEGNFLLHQ